MITIKSPKEIEYMREAGRILALINDELKKMIKVGVTGKMLDKKARELIKHYKVKSSFLNYYGYTGVICVSVNENLIHGIPNDIPFELNDIVSIDSGVTVNGYHSDAAFSVCVGSNPPAEIEKIIKVTEEALYKAIDIIKPGVRIGDISSTVQTYVESKGFYLPTSYTGHGIGKLLHEDPAIPNVGTPNTGVKLQAGMTICIEPMVQTSTDKVVVLKDQWTVRSVDKKPTAHFEHTILVTNDGYEILSKI